MQGRRSVVRRLAAAAIVTGLALVVLASIAGADEGIEAVSPTDVVAEATANLNGAHVGATNPGFTTEGCPAPANTTNFAGTWAWHFVLPGSTSDFVTLTVVFDAPDHTDVSGGIRCDTIGRPHVTSITVRLTPVLASRADLDAVPTPEVLAQRSMIADALRSDLGLWIAITPEVRSGARPSTYGLSRAGASFADAASPVPRYVEAGVPAM